MKKIFFLLFTILPLSLTIEGRGAPVREVSDDFERAEVLVGMTDTAAYFPLLRGKRVAVLANQTSVAEASYFGQSDADKYACSGNKDACPQKTKFQSGAVVSDDNSQKSCACDSTCTFSNLDVSPDDERIHLVDLLYDRGVNVVGIFSPEHGFRGNADAGEQVKSSVDEATGIPIWSLYNGNTKRPSDKVMQSFDVLVIDLQDVGTRFYTYYITMLRMMDACADAGLQVIVLDRPNPNGHRVEGPVLDMKLKSGVGALPIPLLHGLTMGEIARMAVGEGWAEKVDLTVIPCCNYTHDTPYTLPVAPSPNLPTQLAVYLYPTLCLFEGTVESVGRGTDWPFMLVGHPNVKAYEFSFTPRSMPGAKHPPLEGQLCHGTYFGNYDLEIARDLAFSLHWLIMGYIEMDMGATYFNSMFDKLIGVDYVRPMIIAGASEDEISSRWADELEAYKKMRAKYLIYK